MTPLEAFKAFVNSLEKSATFQNWCKRYGPDCTKWKNYRSAILAGNFPTPPGMTTSFGAALVNVGKLVEIQAAKAGYGISEFGEGTFGEQP